MKELDLENMEKVNGGGSVWDCVGVGLSIVGVVTLTFTTGPLWAVAGGWTVWAGASAIAANGCSDYLVGR